MTRRGRCRCGKILKFRQKAEGYKRRCGNCGAVVRLRDEVELPSDSARPAKAVPAWTYAPTEEFRPPGGEIQIAWSSDDRPILDAGAGPEVIADAEAVEWVPVEEVKRTPPRRWWLLVGLIAAGVMLLAGAAGVAFVLFG